MGREEDSIVFLHLGLLLICGAFSLFFSCNEEGYIYICINHFRPTRSEDWFSRGGGGATGIIRRA